MQRLLKRGAAILLDSLLCHEQSREFALAHGDHGELRHGPCVEEPMPKPVVFDRQGQLVSHELDITLNGLRGYFELPGQRGAVGVFAGRQELVNAHHAESPVAAQRRRLPAAETVVSAFDFFPISSASNIVCPTPQGKVNSVMKNIQSLFHRVTTDTPGVQADGVAAARFHDSG